ncbi:MAG TPA: DUF6665 family protein [Longimicrobium sp.]|jgi:hypothetical protein|uniref:DUF6665 family protein n=1 Tax=Longimicrobium sp. TaxID=2029185 RepID=UPI002EDA190F
MPESTRDVDPLRYEIMQEQAAVLARLGTALHTALQKLAAFDAVRGAGERPGERDALVGAAGEALWYYVVQREVLGFGVGENLLRELGVPREVRLRMGLNRAPGAP